MIDTFETSDGKRSVIVKVSDDDEIELHICRNGFQTTVVTLDPEMLVWVRDRCNRFIEIQDD